MLCNPICKVGFNDEFLDELNKLGWIEGKSIVIDRKDPGYQRGPHSPSCCRVSAVET